MKREQNAKTGKPGKKDAENILIELLAAWGNTT